MTRTIAPTAAVACEHGRVDDVVIEPGDPVAPDVVALLTEHLADMRRMSPPESVHALEPAALARPGVVFLTARQAGVLLGCGAFQSMADGAAEIKSMRTAPNARGRGVATAVLVALMAEAVARGVERLYLETGSQSFFAPARRLYEHHGFESCPPFPGYSDDPNSAYFTRALTP